MAARLDADRAYVDALRRRVECVDPRLEQDWLSGLHQANVRRARESG